MEDLAFQMIAATEFSAVFTKILNVLSVVLGLGLVIFFHELGHFAVAKWCNVHVERFSIGIGPIFWSRQKGETEYALSVLPFGGYVKMLGQDDMDPNQMTSSEIAENPRAYSAKSVPQRMAIISAGVIMNVLTGFIFFSTCYWFGIFEPAPVAESVIPGSPAWEHGLRGGDRITAINGSDIQSFGDILHSVVLSSGDVTVEGVHSDGSTFKETMTPQKTSPGRSIGFSSARTTHIAEQIDKPAELIADDGLPVRQASGKFQLGDKVLSVTPKPATGDSSADPAAATEPKTAADFETKLRSAMREIEARYSDRELVYRVERREKVPEGEKPKDPTIVEITIPPGPVRSLGLWMAMGPVRALQLNSVAEKAGMKVGDLIVSVDGKEPGIDIDPLQLPVYFAQQAGKTVNITVKRTSDGDQKIELQMIPGDQPGWLNNFYYKTNPLTIPSIGLGYQVQVRIAKVLPGSEAEKLGVFKPGMKITKVDLIHADPGKGNGDAFGDELTPLSRDLSALADKEPGKVEDINWAAAFVDIQRAPKRQIRLYYDDEKEKGSKVLTQFEPATGWSLWFRGLNEGIWLPESELQKGKSLAEASAMGLRRTKSTAISIYMTLRSLGRGDVAVDSLSGPLGIAKIGYMVAERGILDLLMFLGFLSINLAILNFLPIPILDGGHMVFLIYEGVTRRKPSPQVIGYAHLVGLLFIVSLFALVMYVDISALWGGGD